MKVTGAAFSVFLGLLLVVSTAHADNDDAAKARAKEAYARGLRAHEAHDYAAAAKAFAEADTLYQSPTALSAALDAAADANDSALGAELLRRSGRPGATPAVAESSINAQKKLGLGRVRLTCPSGSVCSATIEGRDVSPETGAEVWLNVGPHFVTTHVDAAAREQTIDVRLGEVFVLAPERAAKPAPLPPPIAPDNVVPEKRRSKAIPPIVVYIGAGISLAFAGATVATGLVAKSRYDDFNDSRCSTTVSVHCKDLHDIGEPLVILTNVFLGAAILSAAATTVIGIGFTDWHGSVAATPGGGTVGIGRRF